MGPVLGRLVGDARRDYMTYLKGSNDIDRVTRAPVDQVDEARPLYHTHATSMLSLNKVGPNIPFELLSDLQRAGSVLPDMPPDFEYFFIAMFCSVPQVKKAMKNIRKVCILVYICDQSNAFVVQIIVPTEWVSSNGYCLFNFASGNVPQSQMVFDGHADKVQSV
jgi:hypothetical protein